MKIGMPPETYFFDVPLYRLPREQYYRDMEKYKANTSLGDPGFKDFYDRNPDRRVRDEDYAFHRFGGAWDFNEIIGFVRLFRLGSQIRGELWLNDAKRHVRTRRKVFRLVALKVVAEEQIWPTRDNTYDNEAIWCAIQNYLNRIRREVPGRVVYADHLEALGPHVDWRAVLKFGR